MRLRTCRSMVAVHPNRIPNMSLVCGK
jgi:hypothetical protein